MYKQSIEEKIQQRILQIIYHSYLYYELNTSKVSDHVWGTWAKELVELRDKYPEEFNKVRFHEHFVDFDGSTGFHLTKLATDKMKTMAQRER